MTVKSENIDSHAERLMVCRSCDEWLHPWGCALLDGEKGFRKAMREGKCPQGLWPRSRGHFNLGEREERQ